MSDILKYRASQNGRFIKEDGTHANIADILEFVAQSRKTKSIQTHNAVNVPGNTWSDSAWIDADGFTELGVTFLNSAATTSIVEVHWSNDGISRHGTTSLVASGTSTQRSGNTPIMARYFRISINNGDTSNRIMSSWAYLKP